MLEFKFELEKKGPKDFWPKKNLGQKIWKTLGQKEFSAQKNLGTKNASRKKVWHTTYTTMCFELGWAML